MDKLPVTVTLICLVIAVALWYVAYSLEGDARWLPDTAHSEEQPEWLRPAVDSPVRTDDIAASCAATEAELRASVESARICTVDSDCTLFDYGYPIECMTSVSRLQITPLRLAYRNYEQKCEFRVYYDCPTGGVERRPVCVNNKCSVTLNDPEVLTEETLDYLGIDR
ncbi:MAG: hypothetical protein KJO31_07255 [Gammaproteobacteria bacterium]|nr:hypothetical protein [Gammaproteobacteria bacterium]